MNLERDQRKDRRKCRGPFPPSGTFTQWQLLTLKLGNFKLLLAVLITAETFSRFYTQKKEDMKLLEPQLINYQQWKIHAKYCCLSASQGKVLLLFR
jgi:hypothetical protein